VEALQRAGADGMSAPAVSVIIPTYGRPALAAAAAASALAQRLDGAAFEVIVVDDGGQDGTAAALAAIGDARLRCHWIEHAGPAAARNAGARLAQSAVLAFLDSDCLAQPGWLAAGLARLAADPALFGVEGRVEPAQSGEATPFTEAVTNLAGGRWLTCDLFVRREAFLALGGFDERFTEPCREDSEFAFRAQAAGLSFAFEPAARVLHPVREVSPWRAFHHAREGRFEALIERTHPAAYRRHFKALDGRWMPLWQLGHLMAPLLVWPAPALALAALGASWALTIYAACRRRRVRGTDLFRLAVPALLAPYARAAWVAWGYWRYPASPDKGHA
jgi:glycosyltransferase involved in cell wall biosynthesis